MALKTQQPAVPVSNKSCIKLSYLHHTIISASGLLKTQWVGRQT